MTGNLDFGKASSRPENNDNERAALEKMMTEAQKTAIELIETKYPKHVARTFVIDLRVGIDLPDSSLFSGGVHINRVIVRRQNRLERRKANMDLITSAGKISRNDITFDRMMSLITTIESVSGGVTERSYMWGDIPSNIRSDIINGMDIIDEDEILEGLAALEYGFGNFEDFYASETFKKLKERDRETFPEDIAEI